MYNSQPRQQLEQSQQQIRRPFLSSLASILMRLTFLMQRPQKQSFQQQHTREWCRKNHRQKRDTRVCFSSCGLGFLIFLSVIRGKQILIVTILFLLLYAYAHIQFNVPTKVDWQVFFNFPFNFLTVCINANELFSLKFT